MAIRILALAAFCVLSLAHKADAQNKLLECSQSPQDGQLIVPLSALRERAYLLHLGTSAEDKATLQFVIRYFAPPSPSVLRYFAWNLPALPDDIKPADKADASRLMDIREYLRNFVVKASSASGTTTSQYDTTFLLRTPEGEVPSVDDAMTAILLDQSDRIVIRCIPAPTAEVTLLASTTKQRGADSDGLTFQYDFKFLESRAEFEKTSKFAPGRIAATLDREKDTTTVDTKFAITAGEWVLLAENQPDTADFYVAGLVAYPFLEYARTTIGGDGATEEAKKKEVNNLSLGLALKADTRIGGRLGFRSDTSLSLAYLTDDSLDGSGFQSELRWTPRLRIFRATSQPSEGTPITGYRPFTQVAFGTKRLRFRPELALVADYLYIDDPGRSTGLAAKAGKSEFGRIGYDMGAVFSLYDSRTSANLNWATTYAVRDGFTDDDGDAQYLRSALILQPNLTSPFSLTLAYERGEVLTSLQEQEKWLLGLALLID